MERHAAGRRGLRRRPGARAVPQRSAEPADDVELSQGGTADSTQVAECVRQAYGLDIRKVAPIPGRAHAEATVYRIDSDDDSYLVKLTPNRAEPPSPLARYLADSGLAEIPAPLRTREGQLSTRLGETCVTLYPFVEGENAFHRPLTREQWTALGALVRAVHGVQLPQALNDKLRQEHYSDVWRARARAYLAAAYSGTPGDEAARALLALLVQKTQAITALVEHAGQLATSLPMRALARVPCHGDLHAGNVLVDTRGSLSIVDWDDPVIAPKERDLMFVGAGVGGAWNRPEEAAAFYRGYGPGAVDAEALAYYRCERIIEDVATFCDRLLNGNGLDHAGRVLMVRRLADAFRPNDVVEIAERTFAAL